MKWPDPAAAPANLANRLLASQDWARAKLAPFAGRAFSLAVGPLHAAFVVRDDGTLGAAGSDVAPALKLSLSPFSVPSFLADPTRWNEFMHEDGDADFGGSLKELARTLPWFVEETFANALGPIMGQRTADTGRKLLAFPAYAAQRFAESAGSYARDEAGLLAHGTDVRALRDEIAAVTARVDALAQRVLDLTSSVRPLR